MAKERNGVVLSDDLFAEYHKFKNGQPHDINIIKRLLHYYKNEIVSNVAQYNRNSVHLDKNLEKQMRCSGLKQQKLEELAMCHTIYKIILNTENNVFPYVNIMDDQNEKIENNISSSYDIADSRQKAFSHLKAICSHAKRLTIFDKYFSKKDYNVATLCQLLPKKNIDIYYNCISPEDIVIMHGECPNWNFIYSPNVTGRHDRYLIVNDAIEIILSSGFDHLGQTSGDFTYIIRPIKKNRF